MTNCINNLAKKNYEEIEETNQPGFILMFIPIEACINTIYTDYDFKKIVELANSKNIIIVGTASLLVTLRLINQLWASKTRYDNVQNIINVRHDHVKKEGLSSKEKLMDLLHRIRYRRVAARTEKLIAAYDDRKALQDQKRLENVKK